MKESLLQVERVAGLKTKDVYADRGYRGHDYVGKSVIYIAGRGKRKLKESLRNWLRHRSAIEAVIGHANKDGRLGKNYLTGEEGDKINAILCGCGYNMRNPPEGASFLSVFL